MTYHRPFVVALALTCLTLRVHAQAETSPTATEAVAAPEPTSPGATTTETSAETPASASETEAAQTPAGVEAEVVVPETVTEPVTEEVAPEPEFQGFSDTELQVLFMFGPQRLNDSAAKGAPILTFQHFSTYRWGSNFFFLDVEGQGANPNWHFWDEKFGLYFEYAPTLSLTKLGLFTLPESIVLRDIALTAQLNLGYAPMGFEISQVWLGGVALNWNIPAFAVFETQFLGRKEHRYDATWQVTIAWLAPFDLGGVPIEFRGFLDVWHTSANPDEPGTEDKLVVLTQPQVVVKVGPVYLGAEFDIRHDFPVKAMYTGQGKSNTWDIRLGPMAMFNF
jgi:hypothetical protein